MAGVRERLIGEVAIQAGILTREQLDECLALQEERRERGKKTPRIGEILAHKGYLTKKQVKALLAGKHGRQRGRFGEIAVRLELVEPAQVERALAEQRRIEAAGEGRLAVGQVLRDLGLMRRHQVRAVLAAQGKTVARCRKCRKKFTIDDFEPGRVRCKRCGTLLVAEKDARGETEASPAQPKAPESPPTRPAAREEPAGAERTGKRTRKSRRDDAPAVSAREGVDIVTRPRDRTRLERGAAIQGYTIRELLGEDMTGTLYRARERGGRLVTFKLLDGAPLSNPRRMKAFLAVAQKSATLTHPAIKRLYAVGRAGAHYFVAMEYVKGDSLRQILERAGRLPVPMVLKVAMQVTDALIHAAGKGLIHRDVRPSNVLLTERGEVKLSGFGVPVDLGGNLRLFAKDRNTKSACYLAPELVVDSAGADSRADIFGLGCMMYHLIAGKPALRGRSPVDVLLQMSERGIKPLHRVAPKAPADLSRIVDRMTQLEPGDRYQSLYQLEQELTVVAGDYPELELA